MNECLNYWRYPEKKLEAQLLQSNCTHGALYYCQFLMKHVRQPEIMLCAVCSCCPNAIFHKEARSWFKILYTLGFSVNHILRVKLTDSHHNKLRHSLAQVCIGANFLGQKVPESGGLKSVSEATIDFDPGLYLRPRLNLRRSLC
jgi:hypothetical protein